MKKSRLLAILVAGAMGVSCLTGCSGTFEGDEYQAPELSEVTFGEGNINYEESTIGVDSKSENITTLLTSGTYYVLHDGFFYPVVYDWTNYDAGDLDLGGGPDPKGRLAVFDSTVYPNIPTLFPGDKLFYYSTSGVYDYTTMERFEVVGWSIGLANLQSNVTGHVYFEPQDSMDKGIQEGVVLSGEFENIYNVVKDKTKNSDGKFLLERIGGVEIREDKLDRGVVVGLERGKEYNVDIYTGTEYMYFPATSTIYYLRSYETYAIWEYTSLQDYLYEIKVPDYLLTGYYDLSGAGFLRIVRDEYYNEDTDYNERLLYPYYETYPSMTEEQMLEAEEEAWAKAGMYSENELLNTFVAKDESCFGWVDKEAQKAQGPDAGDPFVRDQFYEASTTKTSIWLPKDRKCTIAVSTTETTGEVYLDFGSTNQRKVPYDRLLGGYVLEITGNNQKADIVVKGLYNKYTIKLTNAEGYNGQDGAVQPEVETNTSGSNSTGTGESNGEDAVIPVLGNEENEGAGAAE